MTQRWPDTLWIVRHGESAGNVARDAATAARQAVIDIAERDVDVPLSALGERQSRALGRWFASLGDERPTVVLSSPYLRARQTAEYVVEAGGVVEGAVTSVDERLREKEFGILDRLTRFGIEQQYPQQAELRTRLGKFYHRPPGGESWTDVILRLRSALDTISLHHSQPGARVLIVAHQVVVLCVRYLLEGMDERQILEIDRTADIANCGVTEYRLRDECDAGGQLELVRFNFVAPLEEAGAPVTASPDAPAGSK
jgi:2,3-bisphosphoglycerate-dependent phosphoglycerate mutase